MLIYLDGTQGHKLLDLLNTEANFGTLPKCLKIIINDIEEGLKNYEGGHSTDRIL